MKLRNLSVRNVVLRDGTGEIYEIPAYGDTDVNSSLWTDDEFRRTLRLRIRDISVSDDTATALSTVIESPNAATTPLIISGFTAQSADLMQWKNSGGSVIAKVASDGRITTPGLTIANTNVASEPLTIAAIVAQTAALQSWRDSGNAVLARISVTGKLEFGNTFDTNIYRGAANQLKTDDQLAISRISGTDVTWSAGTASDVNDVIHALANGKLEWGAGASPVDTNLYRSAAAVLKTDGEFQAGTNLRLKGASSTITFGTADDVSIFRGGADLLQTNDSVLITASGVNAVPLTVKAVFGQIADLFQVQSSTGSVLFKVTATGSSTGTITSGSSIVLTDNSSTALQFSGASGGMTFGGDTTLFRLGANSLKTAGAFASLTNTVNPGASSQVRIGSGSAMIEFGSSADTNIYRSSSQVLKTDGSFLAVGSLTGGAFVSTTNGKAAIQISDTTTQSGITIGGDTNIYRQAANYLQSDDLLGALGGIVLGVFTTTTRNAIGAGLAPQGITIFNSTTGVPEVNTGSDGGRIWRGLVLSGLITNTDISGGAAIAASKIAGYPSDPAQSLRGDGTWAAEPSPSIGTSLPGSPTNNQLYILTDSTTAPTYMWFLRYFSSADKWYPEGSSWGYGTAFPTVPAKVDHVRYTLANTSGDLYVWDFQYNLNASGANKWEFIGGAPLSVFVANADSTASTSYIDLAHVGPSFTVPRTGEYQAEVGALISNNTANQRGRMTPKYGSGGAFDSNSAVGGLGTGVESTGTTKSWANCNTSDVIIAKYKADASGTATFSGRWMTVTPVRLSNV